MTGPKDIRFSEKKVDQGWKEHANRAEVSVPPTEKPFMDLLTSLGMQAMIHLGEIPHPQSRQQAVDLEAAREIIDLVTALKRKTEGRRSPEETSLFDTILPPLQLKFAEKA